jgi:hypothetical protein
VKRDLPEPSVTRERKPLFTAVTPLAGLSGVTLFEDT